MIDLQQILEEAFEEYAAQESSRLVEALESANKGMKLSMSINLKHKDRDTSQEYKDRMVNLVSGMAAVTYLGSAGVLSLDNVSKGLAAMGSALFFLGIDHANDD